MPEFLREIGKLYGFHVAGILVGFSLGVGALHTPWNVVAGGMMGLAILIVACLEEVRLA